MLYIEVYTVTTIPISKEAVLHWTDFTIGLLIPPYGIYRVERQLRGIRRSIESIESNIKSLDGELTPTEAGADNILGGEPVLPDNPDNATPEEIESYKKAVREAGSTPPKRK